MLILVTANTKIDEILRSPKKILGSENQGNGYLFFELTVSQIHKNGIGISIKCGQNCFNSVSRNSKWAEQLLSSII